jgi:hypothetical protein
MRTSALLAALAALAVAPAVDAAPGKGAKADRDGDGLRDHHEELAGTDPASADTDGDGVKDAAEGAGRVLARRGDRVVVQLFGKRLRTVRAKVTDDTEVLCPVAEDEEEPPVEAADVPEAPEELGVELHATEPADEPAEEDEEALEDEGCSEEDLVRGVVVSESEVAGRGGKRRWVSLTLAD